MVLQFDAGGGFVSTSGREQMENLQAFSRGGQLRRSRTPIKTQAKVPTSPRRKPKKATSAAVDVIASASCPVFGDPFDLQQGRLFSTKEPLAKLSGGCNCAAC
jgi:hypothetical protein